MIATFTYLLPDELYVEGVSGNVKASFTYDGPESFTVFLDQSGHVLIIEPTVTPDMDPNYIKTIDPQKDPAAAYLLNHYFLDSYDHIYEFEDIEMENGDIYKKISNPNLTDAYELVYNFEKEEWELHQIVKELIDPAVLIATERKEYILNYQNKYEFSEDIDKKITNYILLLDEIIDNPNYIKPWKYINVPSREIPKMPLDIAAEFSKIASLEA